MLLRQIYNECAFLYNSFMIGKEFVSILKLAHGSFNALIFLSFLIQASIGLRIRWARQQANPNPKIIRLHRTLGPVLAILGIMGGLSGLTVILLDKGRVMEYPLHFSGGLTVVILIGAVFIASRAIKGHTQGPRTVHLIVGVLLLLSYMVQAVLGLGILF